MCWSIALAVLSLLGGTVDADVATDGVTTRINGGDDATPGRYAYIVSLQDASDLQHFCGGSLIAPDVVLTAAHCLRMRKEDMAVRTRPYNLAIPVDESEIFPVAEKVIHPLYDFAPGVFSYDVGFIKLGGVSTQQPIIALNADPTVPFDGQNTTQMGWGDTSDRIGIYPDILQVLEHSTYIENDACQTLLDNRYNFNTANITDDMLCTVEGEGEGTCGGDSGSPIVIPGTNAEEDVQVGVVSWGGSCSDATSPSMFARVSWFYDYIQTTVCDLSDVPPEDFGCPPKPPTLSPSAAPITPTVSMAPSNTQVLITIQIYFGYRPERVSWRIERLDGAVLQEVEPYTYDDLNYEFITETVSVPEDEILNFVIMDEFGDGIEDYWSFEAAVYIFLGAEADSTRVLAQVEPLRNGGTRYTSFMTSIDGIISSAPFTTAEPMPSAAPSVSMSPASSNPVDITIFIKFDTYPVQTIWEISREPSDRVVARGGPYSPFSGDNVTETITLFADENYRFTIFDLEGDGLCCDSGFGEAYVYFGSSINPEEVLVYEDGQFYYYNEHSFSAASVAQPSISPTRTAEPSRTPSPSVPPFAVTVSFVLDRYPSESSWAILDASGIDTIVFRGRLGSAFTQFNLTVYLEYGIAYVFAVYDSFGDGLCCNGFAFVSAGENALTLEEAVAQNVLLAFVSGDFRRFSSRPFLASPEGAISLGLNTTQPSRSPTTGPTSSPTQMPQAPSAAPTFLPTFTSVPTGALTEITVEIQLDFYARNIAARIESADMKRIIFQTPSFSYSDDGETFRRVISVELGVEYLFTITDSVGNGLCCGNSASIYLGTDVEIEKTILHLEGNFGYVRKQFFVASESGLLGFTPHPSLSPSGPPSLMPSLSARPSQTPSVSSPPSVSVAPTTSVVPVTVFIGFDRFPQEIGWKIESVTDRLTVIEVLPDSYPSGTASAIETVMLEPFVHYRIEFQDTAGDGLCCFWGYGSASVYRGTEVDVDNLLFEIPSSFSSLYRRVFQVFPDTSMPSVPPSLSEVPSVVPSTSPTQSLFNN